MCMEGVEAGRGVEGAPTFKNHCICFVVCMEGVEAGRGVEGAPTFQNHCICFVVRW